MLAEAHRAVGRGRRAVDLAGRAVRLAHDSGNLRYESDALNTAGTCTASLGRTAAAVTLHQRALALARDSGSRYPEIVALTGLAAAHPQPDQALSFALRAVALARQTGFHLLEGHALRALAAAHHRAGDIESVEETPVEKRTALHRPERFRGGRPAGRRRPEHGGAITHRAGWWPGTGASTPDLLGCAAVAAVPGLALHLIRPEPSAHFGAGRPARTGRAALPAGAGAADDRTRGNGEGSNHEDERDRGRHRRHRL